MVAAALLSVASALAPPRVSRRVAVIGGGSAGVVAARLLKKAGHRPQILEAGSAYGGVWADDPTNKVVYKDLKTNLPTVVMQSPDLDFPSGLPSYIDKPTLGRYIESYANAFGVAERTTFGATVTRVAPVGSEEWSVEWCVGGETHTDTFDAVLVANGHYDEPFRPALPGEAEWLEAAPHERSIVHSRGYDDAAAYAGQAVLVVGGRSSGVDIARMLHGVASWVYVSEKKCEAPSSHTAERVTHVPVGTRLCADGLLRVGEGDDAVCAVDGPPVSRVILATGYVYAFPFLDETSAELRFVGSRLVTPLHQHVVHAQKPTLGFVGVPLAVPCPIPFFECQAMWLAEQWARPSTGEHAFTSQSQREAWVAARTAAVGERPQDMHFMGACGGSAWAYMRELIADVHAVNPPSADGTSWLERPDWEHRLATVQSVYDDRGARYPKKPWDDDAYRRCEYAVDWAAGEWRVDDSRATEGAKGADTEAACAA